LAIKKFIFAITAVVVLTALLIYTPSSASRAKPMETLKKPITEVVSLLNNPEYKDKKELQYDKIREIIRGIFDYPTITKLALGKYRKSFSKEQLNKLTDLFGQLLSKVYISKIQSQYSNEKVVFINQDMLTDTKALVKTKIIRDNGDVPVNYSMRYRKSRWIVYDINIEGISLVKNYRTQFTKILFKESPDRLIEKVQEKIKSDKDKTQQLP